MPFFDGNGSWTWDDKGESASVAKSIHEENLWTPGIGGNTQRGGLTLAARVGLSENMKYEECFALSISFQAAVEAYDRNLSRCLPRLYNRGGEEVIAGAPVEFFRRPAPNLSFRQWLSEFVHWWLIRGEMVAKLELVDGKLYAVQPLEPPRLLHTKPGSPRTAFDVAEWQYYWRDGQSETIPSSRLMYDKAFNPIQSDIRGLSPAMTGGMEVTAGRNAALWAKKYFDNSTEPGGMLILPEGVPEVQRRDIEKKFLAEHGARYGNAHRTFVISGSKDVKYEPLEQGFNDGNAFLELQKFINKKVGQLFGVPDIEMGGVEDDTRFKMAPEARKVFFEQRIAPMAERIGELFQHQLVDPWMQNERVQVARPRKPKKSHEAAVEKALAERPDSRLAFILDTDHLPIMGDVQLARSVNMIAFRDATACSPKAACEFFAVDIQDDRPERDDIWMDQKYLPVTNPDLAKKLIPGLIPKPVGASGGDGPPKGKKVASGGGVTTRQADCDPPGKSALPPLTTDQRARVKAVGKFWRRLRIETLKRVAADEQLWGLADADAMAGEPEALKTQIREARFAIRQILKTTPDKDARLAAVRAYFNSISRDSEIRKALGV